MPTLTAILILSLSGFVHNLTAAAGIILSSLRRKTRPHVEVSRLSPAREKARVWIGGTSAWKYLGLVTQIGLNIFFAVLIGVLLGLYMDRVLGTRIIFTLLFIFVGAAAGIWSSYQQITKLSPDELDK